VICALILRRREYVESLDANLRNRVNFLKLRSFKVPNSSMVVLSVFFSVFYYE
jgi:hypothetical protein